MISVEYFIAGSFAGILAGIIPGVGVFTLMVMCYPFVLGADIWQVMSFYIPLSVVSQYTGSVPALLFKIPGESTSFVATEYGYDLYKKGHNDLIPLTAIGSFFATLLVGATFFFVQYIPKEWVASGLTSGVAFFTIIVAFVVIILGSTNNGWVTAGMLVAGFILGNVGYNDDTNIEFLTFGNHYLTLGIPFFPLLVGYYIMPNILELEKIETKVSDVSKQYIRAFSESTNWVGRFFKGSVIGAVCGFIPIAGKVIGVNFSRLVIKDNKDKVVVAESANNASVGTALLPLFALGIPITLGEFLVLDLLEGKYYNLGIEFFKMLDTPDIPLLFLLSGIVGLIASWPLAKYMVAFYQIPVTLLKFILTISVSVSILMMDISPVLLNYYLVLIGIFVPIGYLMRKTDPVPLIFSFVIGEIFVNIIWRYYIILS